MQLTPFQYADIQLKESVLINGIPYFTRRAIGEWLEYVFPQEAIDKICRRNPHIDNPDLSVQPSSGCTERSGSKIRTQPKLACVQHDPGWSKIVNLAILEGNRIVEREARVYDPIGLQLIVFESRQPKAIQYKIAVARLVADMASGRLFDNQVMTWLDNLEPWVPKSKRKKHQQQGSKALKSSTTRRKLS